MAYNAITNLQEVIIDQIIANSAIIDTATIQSLDANVGVIDTLSSNTATLTSANIPTLTNTNMTSTGKIKAPVFTGNITSTNISIGETGDTGTTTIFKTINIPSLSASKIVLTDGSDNLISSTLNDTDLLPKNNPTITGQLTLPLGSNTAPSICFDNDTGMYSSGGGNINFTTNSTERMYIVDTVNPKVQIRQVFSGSATGPAYSFFQDIDSGMYQGTAGEVDISANSQNIINFSTSGVKIPSLNPSKLVLSDANDRLVSSSFADTDLAPKASPVFTGQITIPAGSAGTPSLSITGDLNTGIYQSAPDNLDFSTGGASRCNINNFGIYTQDIRVNSGIDGYLTYFQPSTKYLSSYNQLDLPVSTATQTALNLKSNIADPTFTTKITTPDIVLNNTRVSLGSNQTTTGLTTGCLIGPNCSNGGFDSVLMLNASGTLITSTGASKSHMAPLRNFSAQSGIMLYDSTSKEVAYSLTTPAFTSTNITINGLTASRAVVSNGSKLLTSASFNLPSTSGSNNNLLSTNGTDTTSWISSVSLTNGAFSGVLTLGAGSGSFPSLTFTGAEVDTGIWSSGIDNINIGTNGLTRCLINNNGLQVPSLTASRIVLSSVADFLVSSAYTDTDMAILAVANTFTGTTNTFNNQVIVGAGSVGTPSISFSGDTNTGIYRTATDNFDISVNAVNKLNISTSAFSPKDTIRATIGTNSVPSYAFSAETNSGLYQSDLGNIDISVAGTNKLNISSTAFTPKDTIRAIAGTNTIPAYSFSQDTNSGLYQSAVDNIDISVNGTNKLNISATNFNVKNNVQITSGGVDSWITNGSGNTLFKSSYLSGKYITNTIYNPADTNNWSVFESNAAGEASAFCQNGNIQLLINPGDNDVLWWLDEDTISASTTNNYAWVGWKITTAGVLVASSDRRLKKDIYKIEKENLLENLLGINIVKYKKKPPSEDNLFKNGVLRKKYQQEHIGVIGQNVKKHFKDVIEEQDTGDDEKFISVKYQDLSYYFHIGTQELIRKVQVLEEENINLRADINLIKTFLNI